jgi:hypothetical protein
MLITMQRTIKYISLAVLLLLLGAQQVFAQGDATELESKVEGHTERILTLESSVAKISQMKISGYVQPQLFWQDIDTMASSLNTQSDTRVGFMIRRGRIKFTHNIPIEGTTGSIGAVVYPDINESGVTLREVYATWNVYQNLTSQSPELAFQMGSMNRPFGYEIAYSSSAREVAERSTAENRLFNGERDLGFQVLYSPTFESITPLLELGVFNGSDNFGKGPVAGLGSTSQLFFASSAVIGSTSTLTASGADSLYIATKVNPLITPTTTAYTTAGTNGIKQNTKEFIGHLRLPFLISDEFSFDIGGSWSIGGITPVSDIVAEYSGEKGALVLSKEGETPHAFNPKNGYTSSGIFQSNRSIFGADLQLYLSVLPIGGTIIKGELYTGTQPFYGTTALYASSDTAALGQPTGMVVKKEVMGAYLMLVQNITSDLQLAVRYDMWDPNTNFEGTNAASMPKINGANYIKTNANLGGDLALNTLTIALNAYVGGSLRFMFNVDMPMLEEYTKTVSGVGEVTVADPQDNRFTLRMQYKF